MRFRGRDLGYRVGRAEMALGGAWSAPEWQAALACLEAGRELPADVPPDLAEAARRWWAGWRDLDASVPRPRPGAVPIGDPEPEPFDDPPDDEDGDEGGDDEGES